MRRNTHTNAGEVSTPSPRQQREDAILRLVQALKPHKNDDDNTHTHTHRVQNHGASLDFARRILDSQLGGGGLEASSSADAFASTWKQRMVAGHLSPHQQRDIEYLYRELVHCCSTNGSNKKGLPAKLMTVLTKLIHQEPFSSSGEQNPPSQQKDSTTRNTTSSNSANTTATMPMPIDPAPSPPLTQWSHAMRYEEDQILRELLYALQGLESNRFKFYEEKMDDHYQNNSSHYYEGIHVLSPALINNHKEHPPAHSKLGSGAMDALRLCGEAGWLVRKLQHYVDDAANTTPCGRVARALAQSVSQELQSYHATLASWETQLSQWSLRQWLVRIQSCIQRLTVLGILTEALPREQNNRGGTLLSALYMHSLHGDLRHKSLVQSILYPTSRPWFQMLYLWTTQGLLPEAWGRDFFVTIVVDTTRGGSGSGSDDENNHNDKHKNKYLWHDKYTLDKSQIPHPGIFDPTLVRPAFVVGKGINFIRTCLHQVGWTLHLEEEGKENSDDGEDSKKNDSIPTGKHLQDNTQQAVMERLGYHFVAEPMGMHLNPRLTRTLQQAEKIVHSHILQSLRKDHNLMDHLFALKQFLFHGQGDFFSSLLESLYNEFGCGTRQRHNRNANTSFVTGRAVAGVYPQQLLAMMEAALRTTNAKDLPDFCLERLRVEMLPLELEPATEGDPGHGLFTTPLRNLVEQPEHGNASASHIEDTRTVWDIFMLDYTVPDPLVAIVHENALEQYKLVYSFLFGLRKVEYMLNSTWRQSATLQHALQVMAQNNGLRVANSPGYAHATVLLRKIAMTRQAMTHFCVNLKSYCMLEVLEGGWKELQVRLEQARTLDEAIQAHDHYLEGICRKCLLVKGRKSNRKRQNVGERPRSNKFAHLFRVILSIATEFCALQERLFEEAQEAAERVAQRRREAEQRMTHGQWGFENEQDLAEEASFFGLADAKELEEVVRLAEAFHQCIQTLLEALDAKVNGRSRNMSTTSINDDDDEDDLDAQHDYYDVPLSFIESGEEDDIDSLRFLMFQLDHNAYYQLNPASR